MPETVENTSSSSFSLPPTQDSTSIYFIHPSENPTVPLVSEKFSGVGYGEWKRSMIIALSAKNKMAFVDGSLEKPSENDKHYTAWERCNNVIISYILRSLDNSIARSVIYCTTAREIWQDLEERFSQSSGPQLYSLQQNLHDLTQDPSDSIAEFFTQIKSIWDELSAANPIPICTCTGCTCGITRKILKQQQEERLIQLLMKIDSKYSNVRSNLLMMQPLPNVQLAYRLLSQEEKPRQASALTTENMGHMAFTAYDQRERTQAHKLHKPPVNNKNLSSTGSFSCDFCHMAGHTKERCYRLHGFPPGYGSGKNYKSKGKEKG